jgi:transketolase
MLLDNYWETEDLERRATRDGFGDGLLEAGENDEDVVVLCADLAHSTRVVDFKRKFPKRFFEAGLAEQNMMGVAAGLALSGKIPFVSSFAVFSPGLNWLQFRQSVAYNRANVKVAGAHAGIVTGQDGATHQALEDIALTRSLPGVTVLVPCDYEQTKKAVLKAMKFKGPVYIRFARPESPLFIASDSIFKIGEADVLKKGRDISLIGCGPILYRGLLAAHELEQEGISIEVINNHTVKPLDEDTILESCSKTKRVITLEDHQRKGGLGSAVSEVLAENLSVSMKIMGIEDVWGESGTAKELLEKHGLTVEHIKMELRELLEG